MFKVKYIFERMTREKLHYKNVKLETWSESLPLIFNTVTLTYCRLKLMLVCLSLSHTLPNAWKSHSVLESIIDLYGSVDVNQSVCCGDPKVAVVSKRRAVLTGTFGFLVGVSKQHRGDTWQYICLKENYQNYLSSASFCKRTVFLIVITLSLHSVHPMTAMVHKH